MNITIWKRFDRDTTPNGFGFAPRYSMEKPYTDEKEMIWAEPIEVVLPEGYSVAESQNGRLNLYGPDEDCCEICSEDGKIIAVSAHRTQPLEVIA